MRIKYAAIFIVLSLIVIGCSSQPRERHDDWEGISVYPHEHELIAMRSWDGNIDTSESGGSAWFLFGIGGGSYKSNKSSDYVFIVQFALKLDDDSIIVITTELKKTSIVYDTEPYVKLYRSDFSTWRTFSKQELITELSREYEIHLPKGSEADFLRYWAVEK